MAQRSRIRTYEEIGSAYYHLREAVRVLAMCEPGSASADAAASKALEAGEAFNRTIVSVWLHGSPAAAQTIRTVDNEIIRLYLEVLDRSLSYQEWRKVRARADEALEEFIKEVRRELRLPELPVRIRISDFDADIDKRAAT